MVPPHLLQVSAFPLRRLTDAELERSLAEAQVLRGHESIQEHIDAFADWEGQSDNSVGTRMAIEDTDEVWQIVQHTQVVLHYYHILVRLHKHINAN